MKRSFYLVALVLIFISGCSDKGFKKVKKSALEYKIISGKGGKQINYGNTVEFTAHGYYKDSLLTTPYDSIGQFFEVDSMKLPAEYVSIFKQAKAGDSIVTRILVDSIIKMGGQIPPFAKKGNYLGFQFRILDVITDKGTGEVKKNESMQKLARVDSMVVQKQKIIDDKILSDLIAKDKINAVKTAKGVYVEIKEPGEGMPIDSGKVVTINYKGTTLNGKIFDQSYDVTTGKPVKPYSFVIGQHGAIDGWDDGVRLFKKGGKGRLFIPSGLGYGQRGAGKDILPNECLIFEIEVVDVNTQADYQKKAEALSKLQQLQQLPNGNTQPNPQPQPKTK